MQMLFIPFLSYNVLCFFCIFYFTSAETVETPVEDSMSPMNNTFMYFAYGSNLLSKRIHIQNPTAIRRNIGKLKNYRLDFLTKSQNWNGASATIVKEDGSNVWGTIWEIDISNMKDLDRQEGVERNLYKVLEEILETPTGEQITCRLYQQVNDPNDSGAEESKLPTYYIDDLKKIPHNGNEATKVMLEQLELE